MFDNRELEAMAKEAKNKLMGQKKETEDMYAEFRDEQAEEETAEEERPQIRRTPENFEEEDRSEVTISSSPSEEDWDDEEREEVDPIDGPIFPNGPRPSDIQVWKKEYPDYMIYVTQIIEDFFVFRTINRYEYKQIIALDLDQLQREEMICETCILFPHKYTWKEMYLQKAGVPSTLATIIMEKSGFTKEYAIQVL